MTSLTQKRTQEYVTELELAWLNLLRRTLESAVTGRITFERVEVQSYDNRVWAERVLETIHSEVRPGNSVKPR